METTNDSGRLETPPGRVYASRTKAVIVWSWPVAQKAVDAYDAVLNAPDSTINVYRSITQGEWSWWPVVKALGEHMDNGRWITVEQIELWCVKHEMAVYGDRATSADRQSGEVRDRDIARVEQIKRHRNEHGPGGIITPGDPTWNDWSNRPANPGAPTRQARLPPPPGKRHNIK